MDRVELTSQNIEELIRWRDEHKELVRSHPAPLKAVEIVIKDNGYRVKAIRDGANLRLHLNIGGRSVGKCEFVRRADGMFVSPAGKMRFDHAALRGNPPNEVAQSMLTVYCSLMALMTYATVEVEPEKGREGKTSHKPVKRPTSKPRKRTTYIIRKVGGTLLAAPSGSHASPRGIFSVRGHFRHYKSGKVVWISEYKKGTGKKKSKTYKIGGKIDGTG